MRISRYLLPLAAASAMLMAQGAQAVPISFDNITNNNPTDAASGEAQLSVDVTGGVGQAVFTFSNVGSEELFIADIYFDDDANVLNSFVSIVGSAGVSFSENANPANLPSGNNIGFDTTGGLSADADPPVGQNGVDPGELLTLTLSLEDALTVNDVLAALTAGTLRIGLHVQGYDSGGSESYVNIPPVDTPEPAALGLLGLGILGTAALRRRKS